MIKVKIFKKKKYDHIKDTGPITYTRFHTLGGEGVPQMNTMEECGPDYPVDEYGMSHGGDPDMDGDGVYSPAELYYHFDLNQDGSVHPDEYEQHVKWHARNPHILDQGDEEEQLYLAEEVLYEKKDRCYYLAKSKYDVFPSAYASGFIVRCRKGKVGKKKKSKK